MTHLLLLTQLSISSASAQSAEEPPLAIPASGEASAAAPQPLAASLLGADASAMVPAAHAAPGASFTKP